MTKHDIVPASLAVKAMRDNGYKNAAYALAELMDNSIQADATKVELLCGERQVQLSQRSVSRIHQIAVLDNGKGMDESVLRLALQFGNGTYLDREKHTGIGRFGMGLPSSSISQCKKVEVWSWQNGIENALYTFLDLTQIEDGLMTEVPAPELREVPSLWQQVGSKFEKSGTLVVWSDLDRCVWKTAKSIIDNSEFLIGRMYRRFLEKGKVVIRMSAFDIDNPHNNKETFARPNDPGYLMPETSCPPPFDTTPMFEPYIGENYEIPFNINFRGKSHVVTLRFSIARKEALQGNAPGSLPYGQHAKKNIGVSIVRAGRELELDQSWTIKYRATERWWGIEVDFPPSLDDLFGVTNNKQSARNFAELVDIDLDDLREEGVTITQLKQEMAENEDPRGPLLDIANKIRTQLSVMRKASDLRREGSRSPRRYKNVAAEQAATEATKERQQEGFKGQSDEDESKPEEARKVEIEKELEEIGYPKADAEELAAETLSVGLKYIFAKADIDTLAFFSVKPRGGEILITLNTNHLAHEKLVEILEEPVEDVPMETLQARLQNSLEGLKLLLMAWARYEDEQEGSSRSRVQQARSDWGVIAQRFLEKSEE